MILQILRVAVPVVVVAYCVITQAYMRMFFGSVMGALGCLAFAFLATRTGVAVAEANERAVSEGSRPHAPEGERPGAPDLSNQPADVEVSP